MKLAPAWPYCWPRGRRRRDRLRTPDVRQLSSGKDEKSGTLRVWLFQEVTTSRRRRSPTRPSPTSRRRTRTRRSPWSTSRSRPAPSASRPPSTTRRAPRRHRVRQHRHRRATSGDGGLADVTEEFAAWDEAKDTDPTARQSVTVDGKVYGRPLLRRRPRRLYYRTDVFDELGLEPSQVAERSWRPPPRRCTPRSPTSTASRSAAPTPTARCRSSGPTAANSPPARAARTPPPSTAPPPAAGVEAYTSLFGDDNCPAAKCAGMGGNDIVTAFASGKAAMAIGGDFSHQAVEAGQGEGQVRGRAAARRRARLHRPAFAGGNNIGVLKSTSHRHPRRRPDEAARVEEGAGVSCSTRWASCRPSRTSRQQVAAREPFVKPFVDTLAAGHEVRAGLARVGDDRLLAGAADDVPGGGQRQEGRWAHAAGRRRGRWTTRLAPPDECVAYQLGGAVVRRCGGVVAGRAVPRAPSGAPPPPLDISRACSARPWWAAGLSRLPGLGLISCWSTRRLRSARGEPATFEGSGTTPSCSADGEFWRVLLATVGFAAACVGSTARRSGRPSPSLLTRCGPAAAGADAGRARRVGDPGGHRAPRCGCSLFDPDLGPGQPDAGPAATTRGRTDATAPSCSCCSKWSGARSRSSWSPVYAGIRAVPAEVLEAASLDGASQWRIWRSVHRADAPADPHHRHHPVDHLGLQGLHPDLRDD